MLGGGSVVVESLDGWYFRYILELATKMKYVGEYEAKNVLITALTVSKKNSKNV